MVDKQISKIILGVTGGIAAYKAAVLTRLLTQGKFNPQVVMTQAARRFISPNTMQALSGKPIPPNMWENAKQSGMAHIDLSRDCSLIVIAPASADFLAKLAHGLADDLLSTICLARNCSLMVAPAMNGEMWDNKSTQRNVDTLKKDGIIFVGPESGDQACGEVGIGRMSEPEQIYERVVSFHAPKLFTNKNILITAGGTFEKIDAVRGITNLSSGKMGFAIAKAAVEFGANVRLIAGTTSVEPPTNCKLHRVESANQMHDEVIKHVNHTDIFNSVAAVGDFKVENPINEKLKRDSKPTLELRLTPNPDILSTVSSLERAPFCVGFAAETGELEKRTKNKLEKKKVSLMIGNSAPNAFGSDFNELILVDKTGSYIFEKNTKLHQARKILSHISQLYLAGEHEKSKG